MKAVIIAIVSLTVTRQSVLAAESTAFYLVNIGGQMIVSIYARASGEAKWSYDFVDGNFEVGQRIHLHPTSDGNCNIDLHIVFEDLHAEEIMGLNVCETKVFDLK